MPLEYEENALQNSAYTSPVPLPLETINLEIEQEFAQRWKQERYRECSNLLSHLPPSISPTTRKNLIKIVQVPTSQWQKEKCSLRRSIVLYLSQHYAEECLVPFKPLLFDKDHEIQLCVFVMYQQAGRKAIPILLDDMKATLASINPHTSTNRTGILNLIRVLGEAKDSRATEILGSILQGHVPTYLMNGRLEKGIKYFSIGTWVFYNIGTLLKVLISLSVSSQIDWLSDFFVGALFSLVGTTLASGMLYIALFIISMPYLIVRDNRLQALFQQETFRAMESINDKHALKALMQGTIASGINPAKLKVILKLLPLLEEEDRRWLGRTGRAWLSNYLRETTPEATLILLKATEILGNDSLIHPVQRLSKKAQSEAVRNEAIRVLAILEARRDAEREKKELLRASDLPEDTDTLLRPMKDNIDPNEAQELLRPTENHTL